MSDLMRREGAEAWLAWYRKAEDAYEHSLEHATGVWMKDGKVSEAYLEAVEAISVARWRWRAALVALNAYMDNEAKLPPTPPRRNPDGSDWWNVDYVT
jgi:hypothetical protein